MQRNGTKKGFTLIELIVVLAILAIIAAIAIPTAFSSLEKARDKAARSSVSNIVGIVNTGAALAQLDKTLVASVTDPKKQTVIKLSGQKGVFTIVEGNMAMGTYLKKYFDDSAMQMSDKATANLAIGFTNTGMLSTIYITYYPDGEGTLPYYVSMAGGEIGRIPELK